MPIPNYVRPQLTIEQILQTVPTAERDRLTAVVIGRQYLLNRYGKESNVYGVTFDSAGFTGGATAGIGLKVYNSTTEAYSTLDTSAYTVAEEDVSVWIANGEANTFSLSAGADLGRGNWTIKSESEPNVLVLASSQGKLTSSSTGDLYTSLNGRAVNTGDIFYVVGETGSAARRRTVNAVTAQELTLSGPVVSASFATPISTTLGATANGATFLTLSSTAGLAANMPIISISGATSYFASGTYITSVAGTGVNVNAGVSGYNAATISFANVISSIDAYASVTEALPTTEWTLDIDNKQVTVAAGAQVDIAEFNAGSTLRDLKDAKGTLYISYRALKDVTTTEGLILIETTSDITDNLGTVDLDNEIAYAANEAFSGAQGKSIYALRVEADNTTEYSKSLQKIEATDGVYALAPMTEVTAVKELVATHCSSMSTKTIKNFRRCYVGTDSPGEYSVLTRYNSDKIAATINTSEAGFFLEVTTSGVDLTTLGLVEGDIVKIINSSGDYTGAEYGISEVTGADSAWLTTGPTDSGTVNVYVEFWKADTPESQVAYVSDVSASLANRRAVNVWVENGTKLIDGETVVIPNKYLAAEIAGLRTAVVPQQGLTLTEISGITDAPAMYTRYNTSLLNQAAAAGTMVVTQEAESGGIFIRHQLTTDTTDGSLAYEDSVGVNLDSISFQVKDALNGFVGKKNVTRQTLNEIYNAVWTILNNATTTPANVTYGPQLNGFTNAAGERNKLDVTAHPTLKDRVSVYAKLLMPLPLNQLEVVLDATVDFAL
jgi:hypothetical protein